MDYKYNTQFPTTMSKYFEIKGSFLKVPKRNVELFHKEPWSRGFPNICTEIVYLLKILMNRTNIFERWIKLMAWTMPHGSLQRISDVYQSISDSILQIRLLYPRFWTVNYMTSNVRLNSISGRWIPKFCVPLFFTDFWMNDIGYHCLV